MLNLSIKNKYRFVQNVAYFSQKNGEKMRVWF